MRRVRGRQQRYWVGVKDTRKIWGKTRENTEQLTDEETREQERGRRSGNQRGAMVMTVSYSKLIYGILLIHK